MMPTLPEERIALFERMETKAVTWLSNHLNFFDPDPPVETERLFRRKALVELSLLLAYRVRLIPAPLQTPYTTLLDGVEAMSRRPSYQHAVARNKKGLLLYGLTYAGLRLCGRDDAAFRKILERTMSTGTALDFERTPFRKLDLLHFLHVAGFPGDFPTFEDVFPLSLIAGRPNVLEMNESDAYAVTHALFYITDFGIRRPTWPVPFHHGEAIDLCDALMDHYRRRRNADLSAELVASSICLGVPRSAAVTRAWDFLLAFQEPCGKVPGPAGFVMPTGREDEDPSYVAWKESYHTTIVAALAALMARCAEMDTQYPATLYAPGLSPDVRPSIASISEAGSVAARWLIEMSRSPNFDFALRAGAGLAFSSDIVHGLQKDARDALRALAARLDAEEDRPDWGALGSDTLLHLGRAMRAADVTCRSIEELIEEIGTSIDPSVLQAHPGALRACLLLAELDAIEWSSLARAIDSMLPVPLPEDGPAPARARALLETAVIPVRARFPTDTCNELTDSLFGGLFVHIAQYELIDAVAILRALMLLGHTENRLVRDAAAFLLSQQRPDGAFGYLGATGLCQAEESSVELSITLAVLSALSDLVGARPAIS